MLKLKSTSFDWALKHALAGGETDIFPPAFEFQALQHDWDAVRTYLSQSDALEWQTQPYARCLSPKSRYAFRIATQLDPMDFLMLSALVYEIGSELEASRIPIGDEIVFSWRFKPTKEGAMYDPSVGYQQFQEASNTASNSPSCSHVVVADIADFYPRIYAHRLENALRSASTHTNHALAIKNMLSQWNQGVSYGLPVGSAPTRLLAEVVLDDIDRLLQSEAACFVRFVDDYRIFCSSLGDAHKQLASLAQALYESHGLSLQPQKTKILPVDRFRAAYLKSEQDVELDGLASRFQAILLELDLQDPYEDIDYDDLDVEQQQAIDKLNLAEILQEQLKLEEIDVPVVRFLLRRLGQLNDFSGLESTLKNIDPLYPAFPELISALKRLRSLTPGRKMKIGSKSIALLDNPVVSHLEFHRLWLLSLFADDGGWGDYRQFVPIYPRFSDPMSQRQIILALGRGNQNQWFRSKRRDVLNLSPWPRRAFLAAGSCLSPDERKHWYGSLASRLNPMELAVTRWAQANPF